MTHTIDTTAAVLTAAGLHPAITDMIDYTALHAALTAVANDSTTGNRDMDTAARAFAAQAEKHRDGLPVNTADCEPILTYYTV